MTSAGIQGGIEPSDDDAERRLYHSDIDYFRQHPDKTEFVRPVDPADLTYISRFAGQQDSWQRVRWVLVVAMNQRRDLRIRVPLREGEPHLTDGDTQRGWYGDRSSSD